VGVQVPTLSRRELLLSALGAAAAARCGRGSDSGETSAAAPSAATAGVTLTCALKDVVLNGTRTRLRAYNDQIPGPVIECVPGQRLQVTVKNALPQYDSSGWSGDHNVPHALHTTNLHLHGMDVVPHLFDPVGTADPLAKMIGIAPGESREYVFDLPPDHPPGLNWYHPHHHGSTAVQAASGMAGAIIVRGAIDQVPEIAAARETLLVLSDCGLFPSEDEPDLWTYLPKQNAIWQTYSAGDVTIYDPSTGKSNATSLKGGFTTGDYRLRYYLVNGHPYFMETHTPAVVPQQPVPAATQLEVPRFQMAPGEVMRFRVLNANTDNLVPLVVEGHDLHLLALDGVNFPSVRTISSVPVTKDPANVGQVLLAPANRAEFLIKAVATPGIYPIVQLQQTQQFLFSAQKTIAEIEVVGAARDMAIPGQLPPPAREYPLIKPEEVKRIRQVVFGGIVPGVLNPTVGLDFLLNNTAYQETAVPTVVSVGDVEEWHLIVGDAHHGGTEGHPFHIHVNSFEVISLTDPKTNLPVPVQTGTIKDTLWIPVNTTAVVRMRFKHWSGKSVFHCHILPHEDTGMMQNFLILPDSNQQSH